jgi:hypothetical protein
MYIEHPVALIGTMNRKPRASQINDLKDFTPITPYQKWLVPLMIQRELQVADLARLVGKEYNYIYKIVRGDPSSNEGRNNVPSRPGYELAFLIGEALGDVLGSVTAAEYPIPDMTATIKTGMSAVVYRPDGRAQTVLISESDILHLLVEADLKEKASKAG